jgi:hypothetical protein
MAYQSSHTKKGMSIHHRPHGTRLSLLAHIIASSSLQEGMDWEGTLKWGVPLIAGWFISWKIT